MTAAEGNGFSLFRHRVGELVTRPPATCRPEESAAEVARRLSHESVGSLVVVNANNVPLGIVTDRDLRMRVVAEGRDAGTTPAGAIMSAPLVVLPPAAFAFDAALEMTRRSIRHIVVVDEGRLVGVLSARDLFALQMTHPVTLARDMARADSLGALAGLAVRVTDLVRRLVTEGGSAYDVGQIVAELNDRLVRRVLRLTEAELERAGASPPSVPFAWLAFGSEGRREQTLRTDQDNGLVYADPEPLAAAATAAYFRRFGAVAIDGLVTVGFPRCPGDVMASNPRWCQPVSVWRGYFLRWLDHPSPDEVLAASIYFDLRPIAGAREVAAPLSEVLMTEAPGARALLRLLAREVVERPAPRTLFGNVAVRRRGAERGTVNIKSAGTLQLTAAARVAALSLGVPETNTIERFRAAAAHGLYTPAEVREITDAYQHLMRLRLVHQLDRMAAGALPDNDVDPATLSRADAVLLRDALRTVQRLQAGLRDRFATDLLG